MCFQEILRGFIFNMLQIYMGIKCRASKNWYQWEIPKYGWNISKESLLVYGDLAKYMLRILHVHIAKYTHQKVLLLCLVLRSVHARNLVLCSPKSHSWCLWFVCIPRLSDQKMNQKCVCVYGGWGLQRHGIKLWFKSARKKFHRRDLFQW